MAIDPFAESVTCRLNFEGVANFPGALDDLSPLRNPILSRGACLSTNADRAFGDYSRLFNPNAEGTGYLQLAPTGVCDFGLSDYTVEGRSKIFTLYDYSLLFASQSSNSAGFVCCAINAAGAISHGFFDGGGRPQVISPAGAIQPNTWFHWRIVREDGIAYLFVNGNSMGTPTLIDIDIRSDDPRLGMNPATGGQHLRGFMDEFVITKASRGTTNFTPAEPYDYTPGPNLAFSKLSGIAEKIEFTPPAFAKDRLQNIFCHTPLKSPGVGTIVGTVKEKASPANLPLSRRVILMRHADDQKVAEGWSDAAGNYVFANVDHRLTFYVVSFDHTGRYRAVVSDNLTPKLS